MSTVVSDEPKHILSSHLALRFYKHLGWTKEILDQYVTRGRVMDQVGDQEVRDYWLLDNRQASRMGAEGRRPVSCGAEWYAGEIRSHTRHRPVHRRAQG